MVRVDTAWTSQADQRAAQTLSGRLPALPKTSPNAISINTSEAVRD
jgi:hypothetical protein